MKFFSIYEHPHHGIKAVKQGMSWPAFCFGLLWALYKTMWLLSAIWVAALVLSGLLVPLDSTLDTVINGLFLGFQLGVAFKGNSWYEGVLRARGFIFRTTIEGKNPSQALGNYVSSRDASEFSLSTQQISATDDDDDGPSNLKA